MPADKQRVAILGGGIGALTTAWELQKTGNYDITVYQMGWRLGGKCATGRDAENGYRLEEHGIHGFLGSYYNALEMLAEVFEVLDALPDKQGFITRFDDAFDLQNAVAMWDFNRAAWEHWSLELPINDYRYSQAGDLARFDKRLEAFLKTLGFLSGHLDAAARSAQGIDDTSLIGDLVSELQNHADVTAHPTLAQWLVKLLDKLWHPLARLLSAGDLLDRHHDLRHLFVMIDLGLATMTGLFADRIPERGFDVIDDENFADWLARHGAHPITLGSPLTLNTIALSYQFPQGDTSIAPQMSAASYLDWNLRQFAYLGAFGMLFAAGTGETVIAPLYRALRSRGVRFEFFHKVEQLRLSGDSQSVAEIDMSIQAHVIEGEYDPLIGPVRDLKCWPNHPNYQQLVEGDALKQGDELAGGGFDLESYWTRWQAPEQKTLVAGEDFDQVVLAISIGALPYLCRDMLEDQANLPRCDDPAGRTRWQAMVDEVPTVQTQAMQLWFSQPLPELGLPSLPGNNIWIAGTYVNPLGGQVDFSHLLKVEDWPADSAPSGLLYICGTMPDDGIPDFSEHHYPAAQADRVRYQCIQYLGAATGPLLSGATVDAVHGAADPVGLDFSLLHSLDPNAAGQGAPRFETQFWRANIDPTERYVTSPPGSAKYRLKAGESGYANLFLAGDWIYTGLNVGSVEGTVMGGRLASNALSGSPSKGDIHGYDPFGLEDKD
ncbi:MAG: NAD(P)-binding protein [Xanthomonadales bacterium]|nr:NAD(P)-binding protein [Xanthomonadales bacterium]